MHCMQIVKLRIRKRRNLGQTTQREGKTVSFQMGKRQLERFFYLLHNIVLSLSAKPGNGFEMET